MNRQLVVIDLCADFSLECIGQGVQLDVGDLAAFVAKQVVVRLNDLVKTVGNTVLTVNDRHYLSTTLDRKTIIEAFQNAKLIEE